MEARTVHLFVLDTLADWETGYAVAGINNPEYQKNPGAYRVRTVGPTRDPVRTMGGVTIVPDLALDEVTPADSAMLILPGAQTWDHGEHADAVEKARAFLDAGVPVAAICGATAGLARGGVLDGRRHTSNALEYLRQAPGYGGEARYAEEPAVLDRDLVTAGGVSPVDFARKIFERLELYDAPVLEAWYTLYKHGDPAGFYELAGQAREAEA
ncbi:MAG TPA: type 1 glutamine amidotransferase family protein [Longimicrobium sp.]|nr:type 1 glutamine amidotransferase family protein [Longimicrobium sp.]